MHLAAGRSCTGLGAPYVQTLGTRDERSRFEYSKRMLSDRRLRSRGASTWKLSPRQISPSLLEARVAYSWHLGLLRPDRRCAVLFVCTSRALRPCDARLRETALASNSCWTSCRTTAPSTRPS